MPDTQRQLPKGWCWVRLEQIVGEAQAGFACGKRNPNGVIQLRMNNVTTRGTLDWSDYIRVPIDPKKIDYYCLRIGDVMFNNTNSAELVGKSAIFLGYGEPIVYSNHFTRIRTKKELLEPLYLAFWLRDLWKRGVFAEICNRWIGQSAVKNDKLLAIEIPLPPLPEQKRIAAILNKQMAAIDRARAATEAQLEAINAMPAALLRRAFNGEL